MSPPTYLAAQSFAHCTKLTGWTVLESVCHPRHRTSIAGERCPMSPTFGGNEHHTKGGKFTIRLQPSVFDGDHHGLCTIFNIEAMENFLHIAFNRIFAEIQLSGDFTAGESLSNQA